MLGRLCQPPLRADAGGAWGPAGPNTGTRCQTAALAASKSISLAATNLSLRCRVGRVPLLIARIMETRIVSFSRPVMPPELHLHMAGRVIGRLLPGEERWRIKPPFRLIVDEDSLPGNESKGSR